MLGVPDSFELAKKSLTKALRVNRELVGFWTAIGICKDCPFSIMVSSTTGEIRTPLGLLFELKANTGLIRKTADSIADKAITVPRFSSAFLAPNLIWIHRSIMNYSYTSM
jgi:hypothetical protein